MQDVLLCSPSYNSVSTKTVVADFCLYWASLVFGLSSYHQFFLTAGRHETPPITLISGLRDAQSVSALPWLHPICLRLHVWFNVATVKTRHWHGELKNEAKTHNGSSVYIQLCLGPSLSSLRKHRRKISQTYINTDTESKINLYHTIHTHSLSHTHSTFSSRLQNSLGQCEVTWAGSSTSWWVCFLGRPWLCPHCWFCLSLLNTALGLSPISLEWQWAQLFLSFVMHLEADLKTPALIHAGPDIILH